MNSFAALVKLDIRGITRDQVMLINVVLSIATMCVITVLGVFQNSLPGWSNWFPFMVALALVSGPGGFGYMFGLLMVDENDSGVRDALSVSPVSPTRLMLTRMMVATLWMTIWPLFTVAIMNSTWGILELSALQWVVLVSSLAVLTPVCALAIPTLAKDKVEALAVFKGITFVTLAPLALYFIDGDAWYRVAFLLIPTAWAIYAFDGFVSGHGTGYLWAAGGAAYGSALLVAVMAVFRRRVYRLERVKAPSPVSGFRAAGGIVLLCCALLAGLSALLVPLFGFSTGRSVAVAGGLIVLAKILGAAALLLLGRRLVDRVRSRLLRRPGHLVE